MAVADSSYYPTYGQAYRLYGKIVNVTTGNPIPTLTALACTISKDGGAFSATGVTITETPAASGYIAIDINATGMTANSVVVEATASNGSGSSSPPSFSQSSLPKPLVNGKTQPLKDLNKEQSICRRSF